MSFNYSSRFTVLLIGSLQDTIFQLKEFKSGNVADICTRTSIQCEIDNDKEFFFQISNCCHPNLSKFICGAVYVHDNTQFR